MQLTEKQKVLRVFKPIKDLDAEIRTIYYPFKNQYEEENYFHVEVGLVESLGEQGYNYTFFYDNEPNEKEIREDIKEHIKEELEELRSKILSGREEEYLKIFEKLEKKGVLN